MVVKGTGSGIVGILSIATAEKKLTKMDENLTLEYGFENRRDPVKTNFWVRQRKLFSLTK